MDLKWSLVITNRDSHYFIAQIPEEVSRLCRNGRASLHGRLWGQVTTSGLVYQMWYQRCRNANGVLSRQWVVRWSGAKIYRPHDTIWKVLIHKYNVANVIDVKDSK